MVRLTPRAGRDLIEGWASDAAGRSFLRVRVAAPPADGQANAALLRLIAQVAGRPASTVRIVSGERARLKQLEIAGLDEAALDAAFPKS